MRNARASSHEGVHTHTHKIMPGLSKKLSKHKLHTPLSAVHLGPDLLHQYLKCASQRLRHLHEVRGLLWDLQDVAGSAYY